MSVEKVMAISTAHVPKHTAEALGGLRDHTNAPLFSSVVYTPWSDYGWIFWAAQDVAELRKDHPSLADAISFAHNYGCSYLLLDCDAEVIAELPTHAW